MFQNSVIIIYDIDKKLQYMYGFILNTAILLQHL